MGWPASAPSRSASATANTAGMATRRGSRRAQTTPAPHAIVLDCGGIDFIDTQGSAKLKELFELTEGAGVVLHLARVKPAVIAVVKRDGLLERLPPDRIHANIAHAVRTEVERARPAE